jgi:two-component system, cell cycle response regulator DivK
MGTRILVVDDNEMNRKLLRDVLQIKGYEVLEAHDGNEGVKMATELRPSLILMDVQMPGLNGVAATRILKADSRTKDIKIVSLSAYALDASDYEFRHAGFDDYLAKPLNIHLVAEKVRLLVGA